MKYYIIAYTQARQMSSDERKTALESLVKRVQVIDKNAVNLEIKDAHVVRSQYALAGDIWHCCAIDGFHISVMECSDVLHNI